MTVYEMINKIILDKLEEGVIPWQKMWKSEKGLPPISLSTGKVYNGINQILLSCLAYEYNKSPYFLTYKQALHRGGHIRSGEKGFPIFFFKKLETPVDKDTKEKKDKRSRFILRFYTVFNLEQCAEVHLTEKEEKLLSSMEVTLKTHFPSLKAEGMLQSYFEMPKINFNTKNDPSYDHYNDEIRMPLIGQFDTPQEYYVTYFHEVIHSTGYSERLNRFGAERTDKQKAVEELIGEIGSVYLATEAGIDKAILDNSAAYISYWMDQLKQNGRLFTVATAKAEKASRYVLEHSAKDECLQLSA